MSPRARLASLGLAALLGTATFAAEPPVNGTTAPEQRCATCGGFAESQLWPVKGGIAPIRDGMFVEVGARNAVVIQEPGNATSGQRRWTGKPADEAELVVIFARKVWDSRAVPRDFDLSKAIVISFEQDQVRVFDFVTASGGFFARASPIEPDPTQAPLPVSRLSRVDAKMTLCEIIEALGPPHSEGGSGFIILFWKADDGRLFGVATASGRLSDPPVYAKFWE